MSIKALLNKTKKKSLEKEKFNSVAGPTLFVNNSYCTLSKFPTHILEEVRSALTYENEGAEQDLIQKYRLRKMAYSRGQENWATQLTAEIKELEENRVVCLLKGSEFPTGLLAIVKEALENYDYTLTDEREKPAAYHNFRWEASYKLLPEFKLRYYQEEMADLSIEYGRGVFESCVGSGKTRIMTEIIHRLGVNTLIVLPSSGLVEQTYRKLLAAFGRKTLSKMTTTSVKKGGKIKPIQLVTIQTLASLTKQGIVGSALEGVDAIFFDEFHHSGSKSYTELQKHMNHIYHRFGFTGTFLRNDSKTMEMWSILSNRLYYYPAYQAIKEGYLTPVEYHIYELQGKADKNYQKEYHANYGASEALVAWVENLLKIIPDGEQVLILVDRKEKCGEILFEYFTEIGIDIAYISGDDSKELITDTIEEYNDKNIDKLIGSTVIGEGIDLHSCQHLILARGGKSPIQIVQAIGRAVRLSEGKDVSHIYDAYFAGTKYLGRHCEERVDAFKNQFDGRIDYAS